MIGAERQAIAVPRIKLFLNLPIVLLALGAAVPVGMNLIWSLWGTDVVGVLAGPPSLKWYTSVLKEPVWQASALQSLMIAFATAASVTIFAILAGFAGRAGGTRIQSIQAFQAMMLTAFPMLIYAMGLRMSFDGIAASRVFPLLLGYVITIFPYAYFPIAAASEAVVKETLHASMTLGASTAKTFQKVYVPFLGSAVWLAAVVALLLAWDELVMPLVLLDGAEVPLSRRLWDLVGSVVDPSPAIIATLSYAFFGILALSLRPLLARKRTNP